jgi:hypothetical protein
MRRREFIALIGSAAATGWPLAAHAQPNRSRKLAVIMSDAPLADPQITVVLITKLAFSDG